MMRSATAIFACVLLSAGIAYAQGGGGLAPPPRPPAGDAPAPEPPPEDAEPDLPPPAETDLPDPAPPPEAEQDGANAEDSPEGDGAPAESGQGEPPADADGNAADGNAAAEGEAADGNAAAEGVAEGDAVADGDAVANAEDGTQTAGDADGSSGGEPGEVDAVSDEDRLVAVVIDAAPYGVDPVVGQHVSAEMRETAAEMGYRVVSPADSVAAAQRIAMPYPPPPADLWRVTFVAGAQRGAFARVWANNGRYVVELTVASADGRGPFFARGTSGAEDLHEVVEALTRQALPAPDDFDRDAASAILSGETAATPTPGGPPRIAAPRVTVTRRPRRSRAPGRRFDLALLTDSAIGVSEDAFYNHLLGIRLGVRLTNTFALRAMLLYANLRGRNQREHTLMPMVQFETRIRFSSRIDLSVPLRVSAGYLPFNGPVVRFSAGLNLAVSPRVELGVDLLAPTFWFVPDQTLASLNLGLEVIYRL
ncbi:MAG: hypothetical protein AAF411_14245 [Myxococcota bacterium]